MADWKSIAEHVQKERQAKVPEEWILPAHLVDPNAKDVSDIPRTCGILSAAELKITEQDATEILQNIQTGNWSAEDVCLAFCKRAAVAHQLVNCLTEICFEEALAAARDLDVSFKETGKVVGPLHGLPVSVKDHVNISGLRSTLGFCALADQVASKDALLVQTLKNAGAIVFVKTAMPITGMSLETVSHLWVQTTCGFNRDLVAGGSSGGESALIGLHGSPMGFGTDVGGSIHVPSAFNGLYGLKPSTRRISYDGCPGITRGGRGIAAAIGPLCHSIRDIELVCKVLTDAKPWLYDAFVIQKDWMMRPKVPEKLVVGVMVFDGVVMPHPPIVRHMQTAVAKLKAAVHDVVTVTPYQHREAWDICYPLFYATGGKEMKKLIDDMGEPWFPTIQKMSGNPELKELSVPELYKLHAAQDDYKAAYLGHWNKTAQFSPSGRPMDALLCPVSPCASYPHDFLPWWGYSAQWNLLDYPGLIFPVGKSDKDMDLKDEAYCPINDRDRENRDIYDPELWHHAPGALQLVGRNFEDERLLAYGAVIDSILNGFWSIEKYNHAARNPVYG